MIPVRLHALGATTVATVRPSPPHGTLPFGRPPFKPMTLFTISGDHVVAAVDGSIGEYAIGHLPPSVLAMIRPNSNVMASLADSQKRTMLGILAEKAVDDLHDADPWICPVALALIRMHAVDAAGTLRRYIEAAPMAGSLRGQEFTMDGSSLVYECSARRLTVDWRGPDWSLGRDRLEISTRLPATTCVSALGSDITTVVDHLAFEGAGAVVTGMRPEEWGTEILYDAPPLKVHRLAEAPRRRP